MILAAFHNVFDWTAIGTLALAAATFVSLWFARSALSKTQTSIELSQAQLAQTQEEIAISRQEVEQAQRPVVVPVADRRRINPAGPGVGAAVPRVYDRSKVLMPVENIGAGPALNVVASVKGLDTAGLPSGAPDTPQTPAQIAGLGIGEIMPLDIVVHGWQPGEINFQVDIEYDDLAGKGWKTTALFVAGRYEGTNIEQCERSRPVSGMVQPVS